VSEVRQRPHMTHTAVSTGQLGSPPLGHWPARTQTPTKHGQVLVRGGTGGLGGMGGGGGGLGRMGGGRRGVCAVVNSHSMVLFRK
jgi:hypothetical protein